MVPVNDKVVLELVDLPPAETKRVKIDITALPVAPELEPEPEVLEAPRPEPA